MSENFATDNSARYPLEHLKFRGDINKLGQIQSYTNELSSDLFKDNVHTLDVVNCYT
jgi:hypothetical protein